HEFPIMNERPRLGQKLRPRTPVGEWSPRQNTKMDWIKQLSRPEEHENACERGTADQQDPGQHASDGHPARRPQRELDRQQKKGNHHARVSGGGGKQKKKGNEKKQGKSAA